METRSNYVMVGAVTLSLLAGVLLFIVWLAGLSNNQTKCYDIYFAQAVSGLNKGSLTNPGNGFLMTQGYEMVWAGWQPEANPASATYKAHFPIATNGAQPIVAKVMEVYIPDTPETSGSALATAALAWGINNKVLKRSTYEPVVRKAWNGLVSHVFEDGRLGWVQQVGDRPDAYRETSSYVYGVGGFLLAGAELHKMAKR